MYITICIRRAELDRSLPRDRGAFCLPSFSSPAPAALFLLNQLRLPAEILVDEHELDSKRLLSTFIGLCAITLRV
jgi:hypothetical protein